MEWLQDNAELISALATVLMTVAWVTYAQFAIMTYIRHRQPRIVIDQTEDPTINTRFLIVNLSELPVYISCIMVAVRSGEEETVHRISTYQRQTSESDGEDSLERFMAEHRHGALESGQYLMLGSSQQTLAWLVNEDDRGEDESLEQQLRRALREVDNFEIRIVALVGIDDRPVASSRLFNIEERDNDVLIVPEYGSTRHYVKRRERHVAREWSEFCSSR